MSIWLYGFGSLFDYVSVLSYLSRHGEAFRANQSVNGLVNRLLLSGNSLRWDPHSFPAFNSTVYAGTLATGIVLLTFALLWRVRRKPTSVELALIMLTLTIAPPIAWEHHYGVLLPIIAVAAPFLVLNRRLGRWTAPYLALAFVLCSQKLDGLANM
jgi:alpha-1,2-mannosyltransferase